MASMILLAVATALQSATGAAAAVQPIPPQTAVQLGMSLADWQGGGRGGAVTARVCGPVAQQALGRFLVLSAAEAHAGAQACTEATRTADGRAFASPGPFDGRWRGRRAEYDFKDGRLFRATWWTSADGFNRIVADLHARRGAQSETRRSNTSYGFPRVEMRWSAPGEQLVLTSPARRADELRVSLELAPGGAAKLARRSGR